MSKKLENLKKEELVKEATKMGVKVSSKDTKADIIKKISTLYNLVKEPYNVINKNGMVLTVVGEDEGNFICHTKNGSKAVLKKELMGVAFFKEGEIPQEVLDEIKNKKSPVVNPTTGNKFIKEENGKHRFVLSISKGGNLVVMDNENHEVFEVGVAPALRNLLAPLFKVVAKKNEEEKKSFKEMNLIQKFVFKYFRK